MKHYKTKFQSKIVYIPIKNIVITEPMFRKIKEYNLVSNIEVVKGTVMWSKRHNKYVCTPLNRFSSVFNSFRNNATFPPITVSKIKSRRSRTKRKSDKIMYNIVDGRHRTTSSYIMGYTHVPAIII